ncbi:MAG: RsmE family RNA methyltransferase [Pyrinomonadaceae bacterium]
MNRFFAAFEHINGGLVTLGPEESRHLRSVLRLGIGATVNVFDGIGREYLCRVQGLEKRSTILEVIDEIAVVSPESAFDLTLGATILKGEKLDLVIQKAVELGVYSVIPIQTVRCDVQVRDAEKRVARWQKIALEATKQSGRAQIMQVHPITEFKTVIVERPFVTLFSERGGKPFPTVSADTRMTAVFGPEGGWDDSELEFAAAQKVPIVTLGGRILRAETAAISIVALLQNRFGDLA